MGAKDLLQEVKNADNFKNIYPKLYDDILCFFGEQRHRNIIHMEDFGKRGYYLCNHAVGDGRPLEKLTRMWSRVNCKLCLMRKIK